MEEIIGTYGMQIVGGIGTVVAFLFFLAWKKQSMLRTVVVRAGNVAWTVVREVAQTYTDEITKAKPDGLTAAEKATARSMAVAKFKSYLGRKGLDLLLKEFGIRDEDELAGGYVESAVSAMKTEAKVVKNGVTAAPVPR